MSDDLLLLRGERVEIEGPRDVAGMVWYGMVIYRCRLLFVSSLNAYVAHRSSSHHRSSLHISRNLRHFDENPLIKLRHYLNNCL